MPIIETLGLALVTCGVPVLLLVQLTEHFGNRGWPRMARHAALRREGARPSR